MVAPWFLMDIMYLDNSSKDKAHCFWIIPNFKNLPGGQLKCKPFNLNTKIPIKWCLSLCPKGVTETFKESVSLYLTLMSDIEQEVEVKLEVYVINAKWDQLKMYESTNIYGKIKSYGCETLIKREFILNEANGILDGNRLYCMCNINVSEKVNTPNNSINKFIKDFENMFIKSKFCDITFEVSGHVIRAHKNILCARSNVFAAMFEHEMEEATTNRVVITDIDHEVFKEMLCFMYTGEAPNLDEMANHLLAAADKYNLVDLKVMCEEALCKNLSVEMATDTLIFADLYRSHYLKAETIDFISSNYIDVMRTPAWQNMIKTHSLLFAEAYRAIAIQQGLNRGDPVMCNHEQNLRRNSRYKTLYTTL